MLFTNGLAARVGAFKTCHVSTSCLLFKNNGIINEDLIFRGLASDLSISADIWKFLRFCLFSDFLGLEVANAPLKVLGK